MAMPLIANWFGITNISNLEPLLPIHILWINLVTDSLPALALAFDPADKNVMKRKPAKPGKGVFSKGMIWRIIYQGTMIGALTLIAFCIGLATPNVDENMKIELGQTMAFCVLALSELVHVFNIRNNKESLFKGGVFNNSKLFLGLLYLGDKLFFIFLNRISKDKSSDIACSLSLFSSYILVNSSVSGLHIILDTYCFLVLSSFSIVNLLVHPLIVNNNITNITIIIISIINHILIMLFIIFII